MKISWTNNDMLSYIRQDKAINGEKTAYLIQAYPGEWFPFLMVGDLVVKGDRTNTSKAKAKKEAEDFLNGKTEYECWPYPRPDLRT